MPNWACTNCKAVGTEAPESSRCAQCGEISVRSLDVKEALLRLAGQQECQVEVVEQSDALTCLGCLLRYGPDLAIGKPSLYSVI